MSEYRKVIEKVLLDKLKVIVVDVDMEFIHLDKSKKGDWRLTITKSLLDKIND